MENFEVEIGKRIRNLREKAGYSREKLGEMSNIGAKFLYEIETGKKGMSAYTLYNISQALNVSADYLLTGNNEENNLEYIVNVLSKVNSDDITHIEQIIKHITELMNKKRC